MILANALAMIYMSSFATNFVNWFKEVPGKISNFYQGTKEKAFKKRNKTPNQLKNDQKYAALDYVQTPPSDDENLPVRTFFPNTPLIVSSDEWRRIARQETENVREQFQSYTPAGIAIKKFIDSADFLDFEDEEDLVRKTFAFNVLSEVFRDTYQTALGADGIAWEIGQSIDQLAKETQLWARCSRGARYASREATDRYPGLVRLRNAFSAVLEELVKHLQHVDAIWDYHPVQDNPMQF